MLKSVKVRQNSFFFVGVNENFMFKCRMKKTTHYLIRIIYPCNEVSIFFNIQFVIR